MRVAVPRETAPGERRVALVPETVSKLREAGFVLDNSVPLTEHNRPRQGALRVGGPPVIYEATFRRAE